MNPTTWLLSKPAHAGSRGFAPPRPGSFTRLSWTQPQKNVEPAQLIPFWPAPLVAVVLDVVPPGGALAVVAVVPLVVVAVVALVVPVAVEAVALVVPVAVEAVVVGCCQLGRPFGSCSAHQVPVAPWASASIRHCAAWEVHE